MFEEYGMVIIDGKRFYNVDLKVRSYDVEYSAPYYLHIGSKLLQKNSWSNLILELVKFLNALIPKTKEELLAIKNDWGKQEVFSADIKANYKKLNDEIYINCNHTAVHALWTIQLLLKEWGVPLDGCGMLIRRYPKSEKPEVLKYYEDKNKKDFEEYLSSVKRFSKEKAIKIIDFLENVNNKICPCLFKKSGFDNIFVLEDMAVYSKMKYDILNYLNAKYLDKPIIKKNGDIAMGLLREYYRAMLNNSKQVKNE